jgi:beta-alanine--pyruvate transaminase
MCDHPHVIDIRNMGLIGAVELEGIPGKPTKRSFSAFLKAREKGILIRTTGDIIAMSPPLIISKTEINQLIGTLGRCFGRWTDLVGPVASRPRAGRKPRLR